MKAFARTETGCVRPMNQDSFYYSLEPVGPFPNLFVVADGMGGHKAGDYASRYAIEVMTEFIKRSSGENLIKLIDRSIQLANARVFEKACEDISMNGMGTTIVAGYIVGTELFVANVGDSRLYLAGSELNQVTEDHSYVAEMVRAGELTPEEAKTHPERNVITRAIGVAPTVKADYFAVDLAPDDKLLLCSDGLYNMIGEDRIFEILKENDPEEASEIFMNEACENGGFDNITAIVIAPEIKVVDEC